MFFGLPDPDPLAQCIRIRIWILLLSSKNERKTWISTVLLLPYDFLLLKNDVNVVSKSNKQLTKIAGSGSGIGSGSVSQRCGYRSIPKCHGYTTL
jgi:hypothetical protein